MVVVVVIVAMQIRWQRIVELRCASTECSYAMCPPYLLLGAAIYRLTIIRNMVVRALASLQQHIKNKEQYECDEKLQHPYSNIIIIIIIIIRPDNQNPLKSKRNDFRPERAPHSGAFWLQLRRPVDPFYILYCLAYHLIRVSGSFMARSILWIIVGKGRSRR